MSQNIISNSIRKPLFFSKNGKTIDKKMDRYWLFSLFGTAIGAGILFLPTQLYEGGILQFILVLILVGPVTYISHTSIARISIANKKSGDITATVLDYFSQKFAYFFIVFYSLLFILPLITYGITLTNTINGFVLHYMPHLSIPRWLLSLILVAGLVGIMSCSEKTILKTTTRLTYPLIVILLSLSLYLVPKWHISPIFFHLNFEDSMTNFMKSWPVVTFAFLFAPACSSIANSYKNHIGNMQKCDKKVNKLLFLNIVMLVFFIMFFTFSCMMAMTPEQLASAKAQNIPVLSTMHGNGSFFWLLTNMVILFALVTSFIGYYMGAREGLNRLIIGFIQSSTGDRTTAKNKTPRRLNLISSSFTFVLIWTSAWKNFNVVNIIQDICFPVIIALLYFFPIYATSQIPQLRRFGNTRNYVLLVFGILLLLGHYGSAS